MTALVPIPPGLVVVSGAAGDRKRPLLICEVVGRLILTALQRGFKLRTFTRAAVTEVPDSFNWLWIEPGTSIGECGGSSHGLQRATHNQLTIRIGKHPVMC
jgi:hypothetical protein